jgi:hypothetical protein
MCSVLCGPLPARPTKRERLRRVLADALRGPLGGTESARVLGLAVIIFGSLSGFMLMLNRPGVSGGFVRCLYPVGTRRFRAA